MGIRLIFIVRGGKKKKQKRISSLGETNHFLALNFKINFHREMTYEDSEQINERYFQQQDFPVAQTVKNVPEVQETRI